MELPTYALIIGVTKYQADNIPNLPAAEKDAMRVARALNHWGIEASRTTLLLNEEASLKKIDAFLKDLSEKQTAFRLIFYFCGHGHRSEAPFPESYLLLSNSSTENKRCANALALEPLIEKISRTYVQDIYLFIDACHLRVNRLINPKFEGEFLESQRVKKNLLCLLSSEIEPSYEDVAECYGYFTAVLLKYISHAGQQNISLDQIYPLIEKELVQKELPVPEMYLIGKQSPLFNSHHKHSHLIGSIQDQLVTERGKILSIWGEKGVGKTTLCKNLTSTNYETIYLDAATCPSFHAIEKKLQNILQPLTSPLILFDHTEFLNPNDLLLLAHWLLRKAIQSIFISISPLRQRFASSLKEQVCDWEMPPFSEEESLHLIRSIDDNSSPEKCVLLHLVAKGNPQKIKKLLTKPNEFSLSTDDNNEGLKKVIASIYSCGIYIDESLFISELQLEEKSIETLKKIGLISHTNGLYVPHDLLYTIAEEEKLVAPKKAVLNYWCKEVANHPNNIYAARHFILTIKCFGYESTLDSSLSLAFQTLSDKPEKNLSYLQEAADFFLPYKHATNASLLLAEILTEEGDLERSQKLLDRPKKSSQIKLSADLCYVHLLWRAGKFQLCTETSSEAFKKHSKEKNFLLHRGIAHFFLGNWKKAQADFSLIQQASQTQSGWAQCMLGTITAIVDKEISSGRRMIESSIRLATKTGDKGGMWLGWNNLGEIFWKTENYTNALSCLTQALHLAQELKNRWAELETLKNLLHMQMRLFGAFSNDTTETISTINEKDPIHCPPFIKIQLLNSLATASILTRDLEQAKKWIKKSQRLTKPSSTFHIYTLSNLGMLNKMKEKPAKSEAYFQQAFLLAKKNNNHLAHRELQYNYTHYGPTHSPHK